MDDTTAPRPADPRRKLMDASIEVFLQKGFLHSKVDDVVELANVSHGTFYHYFRNKSDVLHSVVDETSELMNRAAERPMIGHSGSAYQSLTTSIHDFLREFVDHWPTIKTWKEMEPHDQRLQERWQELRDRLTAGIGKQIARSVARGECSAIDSRTAAEALSGMIENYALQSLRRGERMDLDLVSSTLARIWFFGIYGDVRPSA